MYCKHCGKQISDDSIFCQHCGGKVDTIISENTDSQTTIKDLSTEENNTSEPKAPEVVITTKGNSAIQVEVSKKGTNNNSIIANEIVGNLKMIGVAICLFIVYMIGFVIVRSDDAKPLVDNSCFRASCYDNNPICLSEYEFYIFHWEQQYLMLAKGMSKKIVYDMNGKQKTIFQFDYSNLDDFDYFDIRHTRPEEALSQADMYFKELQIPQSELEEYKSAAKELAKKDTDDFCEKISRYRESLFKYDLKKNATYAAIISLLVMIIGRYFVKLVKWVRKNKTT